MRLRNVFVSLEGVDGTGKTSVAKILATDGSFQYYKSPNGAFAQLRAEIDAHATPIERYCFYRLATQFDSSQIAEMLEKGPVVCDRYIASTAAYHFAMDARIRNIHTIEGILQPDYSFLLGTRPKIRDKRLRERTTTCSDVKIERDSAFLNRVAEIFMSFGLIYMDTSDTTEEETASMIRHIVTQGGRP